MNAKLLTPNMFLLVGTGKGIWPLKLYTVVSRLVVKTHLFKTKTKTQGSQDQDQDQDSGVPRPRLRLRSPKTKATNSVTDI